MKSTPECTIPISKGQNVHGVTIVDTLWLKKIRRRPNNSFTADCDQLQYLLPIFSGRKIFGGGGCFRRLRGLPVTQHYYHSVNVSDLWMACCLLMINNTGTQSINLLHDLKVFVREVDVIFIVRIFNHVLQSVGRSWIPRLRIWRQLLVLFRRWTVSNGKPAGRFELYHWQQKCSLCPAITTQTVQVKVWVLAIALLTWVDSRPAALYSEMADDWHELMMLARLFQLATSLRGT